MFALALEVPARGVNVAFEQEKGVTVEFEVGCLALGCLLPQAHAWVKDWLPADVENGNDRNPP